MSLRLREACTAYLERKNVTLWSDWDLSRDDSFEDAVTWLATQVLGVLAEV